MFERWLNKIKSGLFKSELPEYWANMPLVDMPILAIDLELTSLDTSTAKIASAGWVEGQRNSIDLGSSYHQVVKCSDLAQSPVVHGLTAQSLLNGVKIHEVLKTLATYSESHVWLFHNANLDSQILNRVMAQHQIYLPNVIVLDTLQIELYQYEKSQSPVPENGFTLSSCRERYGLMEAPAHNALDDAMATLQLWFAQQAKLNGDNNAVLSDIRHTGGLKVKSLGKKVTASPPKLTSESA